MDLKPGTLVAGRFRLVRTLGEGGMGSVWFAQHTGLNNACAVKFIHADVASDAGVRARFEREAKVAASLRSPHVVHMLDYGVWEGVPYIAMEYLDGEDLGQRLHRQGRLSREETASVVAQVARALTKAHAAGLVHRDLKPENVYVVRDDDHEIIKVLDFGVAKSQAPLAGGHTRTGAMLGTPCYMSPEQAQGTKQVDHRTDLWALGIIAYRCLVGRLPFDSEALGDLLLKIMMQPLPVPSQHAPDLPPAFDAFWARAAARDAAARFQSAKELSETLAQSLGVAPSLLGRTPAPVEGTRTSDPTIAAYPGQSGHSSRPPGFAGTTPATPAGFAGAAPFHTTPAPYGGGVRAQTPMHPATMHAHPVHLTPGGGHLHATVSEPPPPMPGVAGPGYAVPPSVPPAAHTFDGRAKKSKSTLVVAVVGVLGVVGGGALVMALQGGGDKGGATHGEATATGSAPLAPPPATAAAVTAEPVVAPQPTVVPSATAAAAAVPPPVLKPPPPRTAKVQPPPPTPPTPPPAPARTGKVVISP